MTNNQISITTGKYKYVGRYNINEDGKTIVIQPNDIITVLETSEHYVIIETPYKELDVISKCFFDKEMIKEE